MAIVTAGLMWQPERWPSAKIIAMTMRPKEMPMPTPVTAPPLAAFTATEPGPAKTSAKVPRASARYGAAVGTGRMRMRRECY